MKKENLLFQFVGQNAENQLLKIGFSKNICGFFPVRATPQACDIKQTKIGAKEDLLDFISKYYPEFYDVYRQVYSHNYKNKFIDFDHEQYFAKSDYFSIMLLAFSNAGTNRVQIRNLYGFKGEKRLTRLLKEGVLKENLYGDIKVTQQINITPEVCQQLLMLAVKHSYRPENIGISDNWLTFSSEAVDRAKVMPQIKEKLKKVNKEIAEIINDPVNHGDEVVFVGMVADAIND